MVEDETRVVDGDLARENERGGRGRGRGNRANGAETGRGRGGRGGRSNDRFRRERAPTRPGWDPTGTIDEVSGRPAHSGQCEGCRVSTVVNFRPVVGGNPPLCGVCLDSLKAATAGTAMEGDASGGPNRGRRMGAGGFRNGAPQGMVMPYAGFAPGARFSPYGAAPPGGQMVMIDPRMMAAYGGGRGMGGMMMAPFGGAPGGGRGKNKSWSRDGADAGAGALDTSGVPCIFFQRGSCRAGDACKYLHGLNGEAAVAEGTSADMNVE